MNYPLCLVLFRVNLPSHQVIHLNDPSRYKCPFRTDAPKSQQAAEVYAQIVSSRSRQGRPIAVEDAQIAAIALSADLELATRNIKDFLGIEELKLVNPWEL